jgi:hypothetical protein
MILLLSSGERLQSILVWTLSPFNVIQASVSYVYMYYYPIRMLRLPRASGACHLVTPQTFSIYIRQASYD